MHINIWMPCFSRDQTTLGLYWSLTTVSLDHRIRGAHPLLLSAHHFQVFHTWLLVTHSPPSAFMSTASSLCVTLLPPHHWSSSWAHSITTPRNQLFFPFLNLFLLLEYSFCCCCFVSIGPFPIFIVASCHIFIFQLNHWQFSEVSYGLTRHRIPSACVLSSSHNALVLLMHPWTSHSHPSGVSTSAAFCWHSRSLYQLS